MKAIILAGGMGTRLRGVISEVPKPMALVGGKPFLEYIVLQLRDWGICEIVLSVGYKKEIIKDWFGNGSSFDMHVTYAEEDEPLGTGGAVKEAISMTDGSSFIVMNGDSYFNVDLTDLITDHADKPAIITMSLACVHDRRRYGGVEVDEAGRVIDFQRKGSYESGLINGGIYCIDRNLVNYIPDGHVSLEGDVLPRIQEENRLYGRVFDGFFVDMGLPEDYLWIDRHPEYLRRNP